jgi:hypothetical protein
MNITYRFDLRNVFIEVMASKAAEIAEENNLAIPEIKSKIIIVK